MQGSTSSKMGLKEYAGHYPLCWCLTFCKTFVIFYLACRKWSLWKCCKYINTLNRENAWSSRDSSLFFPICVLNGCFILCCRPEEEVKSLMQGKRLWRLHVLKVLFTIFIGFTLLHQLVTTNWDGNCGWVFFITYRTSTKDMGMWTWWIRCCATEKMAQTS